MAEISTPGDSQPQREYASPLMNLEGMALVGLILQFVSGAVNLYYSVPAILSVFAFYGGIPPVIDPLEYVFIVEWMILPFIGLVQVYAGLRIYKKDPTWLSRAIILNILASILLLADIIASQSMGILFIFPEVLGYFVINVITIFLLRDPKTKSKLLGEAYQRDPYEYRQQW